MKQLKSYGILENGKKGSLLTHPVNQILTVNLSHYACKAKKKKIVLKAPVLKSIWKSREINFQL